MSVRLDNVIADQRYILECLELLRRIRESGNCHTCDNKECKCQPEWGEMIRYNCPFYKEKLSKREEELKMMVLVYRPNDEEDRKKVLNYAKDIERTGKKPMGVMIYAPEEDVKKWQDKADECGWPLQLYITSLMNGYCKYLEEGAEEGNDFDGIGAYVPFT